MEDWGLLDSQLWNIMFVYLALAGMAQWNEREPVDEKLTGLIPSQGTWLGGGPDPQLGRARGNQLMFLSYQCFSPSLSPSFPLSLKINK